MCPHFREVRIRASIPYEAHAWRLVTFGLLAVSGQGCLQGSLPSQYVTLVLTVSRDLEDVERCHVCVLHALISSLKWYCSCSRLACRYESDFADFASGLSLRQYLRT